LQKEVISQKQAILLITTFIMGIGVTAGIGGVSKQDVWLAMLISMAASTIIIAVFCRIIKLFPQTDLFNLLDMLFGKIVGRIIALIFTWYAFHVGMVLISTISEFIRIVSLDSTPQCVITLVTGIVIAYAVRCGIEAVGRWVTIFFPVIIVISLSLTLLAINMYDYDRLKPFLYDGFKPVLQDAFTLISRPFAETVIFLGIAGCFQKSSNPYKIFYYSMLIGGFYLLQVSVRTIILIGTGNTSIQMFPPYVTVRLIKLGDFIQRIELIGAVSIVTSVFTKATAYLFFVSKGVSHLLNMDSYHVISTPVVLLTAAYSLFLFDNAVYVTEWAEKIFPLYALPYQILLPIIIWIAAEIKARKGKSNSGQNLSTANNNAGA